HFCPFFPVALSYVGEPRRHSTLVSAASGWPVSSSAGTYWFGRWRQLSDETGWDTASTDGPESAPKPPPLEPPLDAPEPALEKCTGPPATPPCPGVAISCANGAMEPSSRT